MMLKDEQHGPKVTPEMIRAGVIAFWACDREGSSAAEIVGFILEAALESVQAADKECCEEL